MKGGILIKAFLQILGTRMNEHLGKRRSSFTSDGNVYEGMPYSCMLARLQTSVVRALSIILRHTKSAVIAREWITGTNVSGGTTTLTFKRFCLCH